MIRKNFTLLLICIMLLCMLAGCVAKGDKLLNIEPNADPNTLSQEDLKQLNSIFIDTFDKDGLDLSSARHYGTYDGCVVLFNRGQMVSAAFTLKTITDEVFPYTSGFNLYVFKNGKFAFLENAYKDGWITKEAIQKAATYHDSLLPEHMQKIHIEIEGNAEPNTLSSDVLTELTNSYNEKNNAELSTFIHYGTYDGVTVLYSSGEGNFRESVYVNEYNFTDENKLTIVLYKKGYFRSLVSNPWLTNSQLADLYEYHQNRMNK